MDAGYGAGRVKAPGILKIPGDYGNRRMDAGYGAGRVKLLSPNVAARRRPQLRKKGLMPLTYTPGLYRLKSTTFPQGFPQDASQCRNYSTYYDILRQIASIIVETKRPSNWENIAGFAAGKENFIFVRRPREHTTNTNYRRYTAAELLE
ncbi:MAG: hypothetical protein IKC76_05765 [Firmicutes bacterium]|nr:hypothetical protein [Bacillota bacterium]